MNSQIEICRDHESLSSKAATLIKKALARKPDLLLCAAGGSTPLRTYELLAKDHVRHPELFTKLRVVKLDEWGGIAMNDPGTCENQIRSFVLSPLHVADKRYFGFDSHPVDPKAECERIRRRLTTEGPIDFCMLGLGMNGHLAMNEPAPSLKPSAHVARLKAVTLAHPMLAQSKSQPTYGLSLGMAEIMASREILLLVSGANKCQPLRKFLRREITTEFPASFLWLHSNWTLLCDADSAEGLNLTS